ncbi:MULTISPECIES: GntR family transcriptional regulator [Falsihalocynthiibacter]|jgi:DNA-binding GntR family transcriptional regulator|uniref:GntR family transcriptional regulator n=1 Tax=Falsihalocynthiibacter TaxID=2854182 RepID=UPI003002C3F3
MARLNDHESEVYDRIRAAISARQLLPGQRLREVELCRIFGTTRGTVRKIFARLAFDGLVDHQPNRGASVAKPSTKEATDMFIARRCIETTIAREAALRLKPEDITRLRTHIEREKVALEKGDKDRLIALSGEFHVLLAGVAENSVLKRYLIDLIARESLIIQLFEKPGVKCCSHEEHSEILDALISSDLDLLDKLISDHIDGIAASLDLLQLDASRPSLYDVFS